MCNFFTAFFMFIDKYKKRDVNEIANGKFENQETSVMLAALVSCLKKYLLTNAKTQDTLVTLAALVSCLKFEV